MKIQKTVLLQANENTNATLDILNRISKKLFLWHCGILALKLDQFGSFTKGAAIIIFMVTATTHHITGWTEKQKPK